MTVFAPVCTASWGKMIVKWDEEDEEGAGLAKNQELGPAWVRESKQQKQTQYLKYTGKGEKTNGIWRVWSSGETMKKIGEVKGCYWKAHWPAIVYLREKNVEQPESSEYGRLCDVMCWIFTIN